MADAVDLGGGSPAHRHEQRSALSGAGREAPRKRLVCAGEEGPVGFSAREIQASPITEGGRGKYPVGHQEPRVSRIPCPHAAEGERWKEGVLDGKETRRAVPGRVAKQLGGLLWRTE